MFPRILAVLFLLWLAAPGAADSPWKRLPGLARDLAIGADGSAWVIGTNAAPGGYGVWQWTGSDWAPRDGAGVKIAVDPSGQPWVINSMGSIFRRQEGGWKLLPGLARDLSIGADGSAWILGTNEALGGTGLWRWDGGNWKPLPNGGVALAVAPDGRPWVISSDNTVWRPSGSTWSPTLGKARDLAVGADGTVWVVGMGPALGGYGLWRWDGSAWRAGDGGGVAVAVDPAGKPWVVAADGSLWRRD